LSSRADICYPGVVSLVGNGEVAPQKVGRQEIPKSAEEEERTKKTQARSKKGGRTTSA